MLSRLRAGTRPSPAIIVAVVALIAALAGTAVAANPTATSSAINKKKVKKIATKQIDKLAPGLSVARAETANTANSANSADTVADGAVTSAKLANGGVTSQKLGAITLRTAADTIAETNGNNPDRGEVDCQPGETALAPHMAPLITQDDGDLSVTEMTFDPNGATGVAGDEGWIIGVSNLDADADDTSVSVARGVLCLTD